MQCYRAWKRGRVDTSSTIVLCQGLWVYRFWIFIQRQSLLLKGWVNPWLHFFNSLTSGKADILAKKCSDGTLYHSSIRAVFIWVSKSDWFCSTALYDWFRKLAPLCHPIRSKTQTSFPTLCVCLLLRVLIGSLYCLCTLWLARVITLVFGFTTLNWNVLELLNWHVSFCV